MATEPTPRYLPDLDGLRAVAVAAVAWSHWLPAWQFGVPFGAGVHLFFVLSGMLITRILLDLRDEPGRGRAVGRFYVRRLLRLWPAFYVVLFAAWLAGVPLAAATWPWHAAYLSNAFIARQGEWQGHFSHLWSLAVEQQFYLLWPWLVVWAPVRVLPLAFVATVLLGPLSRGVAAMAGATESFWALVPGGSADSLGLGALIAWLAWAGDRRPTAIEGGPSAGRRAARVWPVAGAAGLGAWLLLAVTEGRGVTWPAGVIIWRQTLQGVVFAWIVWRAVAGFGGAAGPLLRHPVVLAVGRISYGIYLVHPFAPVVLDAALQQVGYRRSENFGPGGRAIAAWLTSVGLATLLWHLVEAPSQRLKPRTTSRDERRADAASA